MQPLGRRRWFVIVWTVAAAMMLASIIRVWTIPVDGANIGAGLIVIGIPGMILPGLLCLLAVESKWLLPKPSRTLQFVGLLLALATTFPSLHWIWQSYTTALPIPIFEGPLFLALGNPLWLLLSDILLLFLGPVSGAFYGEQLGDIVDISGYFGLGTGRNRTDGRRLTSARWLLRDNGFRRNDMADPHIQRTGLNMVGFDRDASGRDGLGSRESSVTGPIVGRAWGSQPSLAAIEAALCRATPSAPAVENTRAFDPSISPTRSTTIRWRLIGGSTHR